MAMHDRKTALVSTKATQPLQPWLLGLTADDQARVNNFVTRASAEATLRAYRFD